jgi:LDH2 family malate/lactate/ureidoglycolate dehydrogenase
MKRLTADRLRELIVGACEKMGAKPEAAAQVAASLVGANLCGYDSHGIHRLVQYHEWWKAGLLDPTGRPIVVEETAFTTKVDGGQTFGPVVGVFATREAIRKAQETGIGIVTVRRSTQVGRLADYAEAIQQAGLIGLVTVNDCGGGQFVVPWGGMEARLATNPIAMGIPGGNGPGILFDFATSAAAFGKVRQLLFRGETTPPGWLLDASGKPSTDPSCLFTEPQGALLPAGEHKGYAMSLAVEVLSGILSGAGFSSPGPAPEHLNGMFILALNVAWFVPLNQFREQVDQLTTYIKSAKPLPGGNPVRIPGEPDREEAARRTRDGILFSDQAWEKVTGVLRDLGLGDALQE